MKVKKFATQIDEKVLKELKSYVKATDRSIFSVGGTSLEIFFCWKTMRYHVMYELRSDVTLDSMIPRNVTSLLQTGIYNYCTT